MGEQQGRALSARRLNQGRSHNMLEAGFSITQGAPRHERVSKSLAAHLTCLYLPPIAGGKVGEAEQ
eukprot:6751462-Pyramimonas_sp.AAC.1